MDSMLECLHNVPKAVKQFAAANGCFFGQSIVRSVYLQEDSIPDKALLA
jgi:hypothetical protein